MSASPKLTIETRQARRKALLKAAQSAEGQEMLRAIKPQSFEQAINAVYDGYAKMLADVWGYDIK